MVHRGYVMLHKGGIIAHWSYIMHAAAAGLVSLPLFEQQYDARTSAAVMSFRTSLPSAVSPGCAEVGESQSRQIWSWCFSTRSQ